MLPAISKRSSKRTPAELQWWLRSGARYQIAIDGTTRIDRDP
jgi:hypothetical protein